VTGATLEFDLLALAFHAARAQESSPEAKRAIGRAALLADEMLCNAGVCDRGRFIVACNFNL
jgi:hypothetical protein